MDNLVEVVKDEPKFERDPANEHVHHNSRMILSGIAEKYQEGSVLADLTSGERRKLEKTSLCDIVSADCPAVIRKLKLESLTGFMISLEKDLNAQGMIHPRPDMIAKLHDITCLGTEAMKVDGTRILKLLIKTTAGEIERKYDAATPPTDLSQGEIKVIRYIRPLVDDTLYPEVVLALHWELIEQDLDEDFEKLASDPEYEVQNIPKLICFYSRKNVPENIKTKALELRKLNENIIVERLPHKYNLNCNVDELTETEKAVLRYIRPLDDDTLYPETVLALHWRIIEQGLDEDFEKLASVPEYEVENVPRLIRFSVDNNVPEHIKTKAKELRKINKDVIVERLPHKYNLNSNVDELTETERVVLDRLDVIRNSYHPLVEYLHWELAHLILCKEWRAFKAGDLEIANYMPKKLAFLSTNDRVPDITKQLAKEFQEAMSRE